MMQKKHKLAGKKAAYTKKLIRQQGLSKKDAQRVTRLAFDNRQYVYAASNPSFSEPLIKIGFSANLNKREKSLNNTSVPEDFKIIVSLKTKDGRGVEKALHDYFREKRYTPRKEFFRVTEEEVLAAFELIEKTGGGRAPS